jgi:hypothetical protein
VQVFCGESKIESEIRSPRSESGSDVRGQNRSAKCEAKPEFEVQGQIHVLTSDFGHRTSNKQAGDIGYA